MSTHDSPPNKSGRSDGAEAHSSTNSSEDTDEESLAVDYGSLRYIQLRGDDSKLPARKWGGYNQDFDAAEHVHTHDEIVAHDADAWGIVDCEDIDHGSLSLLILDIDSHKAPIEFDVGRLNIPEDTLVTRSQNGGFHVYFRVHVPRGELNESDFAVADELPFDIDIRGSAVSHHVVAPADIPGAGGSYEIVNDTEIAAVMEPAAAAERIQLDDEPALEFGAQTQVNIDWDRPDEAPEDMPACYHAGLSLRHEAPDEHPNTHKVNVLAALCGLAAGYEADDIAAHMCGEYAPQDGGADLTDKEETEYQVRHIEGMLEAGQYSPPALSTLRAHGILDEGESCGVDCPIDRHNCRSPLDTVQEFIDEYEPIPARPEKPDLSEDGVDEDDPEVKAALEEWPSDPEKRTVMDAMSEVGVRNFEAVKGQIAERLQGMPQARLKKQRRMLPKVGELMNYGGELVYVQRGDDDAYAYDRTILNFELEIKSLLSVEGEGRMANIEARPSEPTESKFDLQIAPRVFNDSRRFKDEVLAQRFSTTIDADMHESDVMDMLRQYVACQDVPQLTGQKQMGLSSDASEFVTPTGTINADGWTGDPDTIYVEQSSGAEREFNTNPDDHDESEIVNDDVAEILELFTRTRDPERFIPVIGWLYAAPFRPLIVDRTGAFNLLHVNGESGVGKTGTLGVGSRLFGMSGEPFSASDTTFAHIKTFASSKGTPMWLDEYKTSELPDWKKNALHDLLRKTSTGGIEKRGTPNDSENVYHLRAPVMVSGETSIRGSAEQRRAISTTFTNQPTVSGTPEYQRFKDLIGDAVTDEDGNVTFPDANYELEQHAVKYYEYVTSMTDTEFENKWFSAREYVSAKLAEWDTELDDLEVQGLQTVAFGFRTMRGFGEEMGADLSELPGEGDLDEALRYVADVEGDGRETHTDQFVMLVQRAAVADYLERGTHYDVVREGKAGEELRVNVNRAFDAVSKYVRDHDLSEDLLGSAKDYTDRFTEAEDQDTYVATTSQGTPGVGRCVGIHTGTADDEIESFDRTVFVGYQSDEGSDRPEIRIDDVADVRPDMLTLTGERVDVVGAGIGDWNLSDTDVHAFGYVGDRYAEDSTVDVVAFDEPKGDAPEEGCEVEIRGAVVGEYQGELQLQFDEDTAIHVQEETDEDQETMNDAADTVNDDEDDNTDGEGEGSASDAGEEAQDAGSEAESDTETIDRAVMQAAQEGADSVAAVAGRVASMVKTDDLETIKSRVEKLAERGDIILDDVTFDSADDDEDGGNEPKEEELAAHIADTLNRATTDSRIDYKSAEIFLLHDTDRIAFDKEREALEFAARYGTIEMQDGYVVVPE